MAADPDPPLKRLGDYPMQHSGDFLHDINHCRSIIEAHGMEMLVLDQTRADVGMPVVKVVVPGLRHFWARLCPGALVRRAGQDGLAGKTAAGRRTESRFRFYV